MTYVLLFYWIALVFWQNINPGSTGTLPDTIIKLVLLTMLAGYYLLNAQMGERGGLAIFILLINMLLSFFMEPVIGLRALLTYFFPVFVAMFSLYFGSQIQITQKQFLIFLKVIICVVLYMAIYAVFDTPEKFTASLLVDNAYGNELSSFFVSSHEYALYLTAAIVSCLICAELDESGSKKRKFLYFLLTCFFLYNLILSFSRTFLLGAVCFVVIYALLNRRSLMRNTVICSGIILLALIVFVPEINRFFFDIVLKGNNLAGRDSLNEQAIRMFSEGTTLQKLWGFGASNIQEAFRTELGHSSMHNAYFQVLLYFGACGLVTIVVFLCHCARSFWKVIKKHRLLGVVFFAQVVMATVVMFFNTCTLFFSSCDSFFFTMFFVVIPIYVRNAIRIGTFEGGGK